MRARIGIDDALDRNPPIGRVGASEGAGGPERHFAGGGPEREVSHPRQPWEVNAGQVAQAAGGRIKEGTQDARPL